MSLSVTASRDDQARFQKAVSGCLRPPPPKKKKRKHEIFFPIRVMGEVLVFVVFSFLWVLKQIVV